MPNRIAFSPGGRALHGMFAGMEQSLGEYVNEEQRKNREERMQQAALVKDLTDKVMAGTIDPDQAENAAHSFGASVTKGFFHTLQPSVAGRMQAALGDVNKATSAETFPTREQSNLSLNARGLPSMTKAEPTEANAFTMPNTFTDTNPDASRVYEAKQSALRGAIEPKVTSKGQTGTGMSAAPTETRESYVPEILGGNNSLTNAITRIVGPTAGEAGAYKGAEAEAAAPGQTAAANIQERGTRGEKIQTEIDKLNATEPIRLKYSEALSRYNNDLQQGNAEMKEVNNPLTGETSTALIRKRDGKVVAIVDLPGGYQSGGGHQLPAAEAEAMTGLNVAEQQGVQVLRALEKTGLMNSNDPLDPRWRSFLQTTLKIDPGNLAKADILQRTNMINAVLMRGLMGGRPAQYIAQLLQAHMPQGDMSGKLLYDTLERVMQQTSERRENLAQIYGLPLPRLAPKGPNNYSTWQREHGIDRPGGTADLVLDANGNLVPSTPRRQQ